MNVYERKLRLKEKNLQDGVTNSKKAYFYCSLFTLDIIFAIVDIIL